MGWANSIQALINDIEQESPGMIDANKLAAYIALNRFNTLEPNNTVWETFFRNIFDQPDQGDDIIHFQQGISAEIRPRVRSKFEKLVEEIYGSHNRIAQTLGSQQELITSQMKAIVDWYSTATGKNADYSLLELPRDQAISRLNQMISEAQARLDEKKKAEILSCNTEY